MFLTTGGMGPACSEAMKRLAELIAVKRDEKYSHTINFIRVRLRFALLKSVLIAIRGVRGKLPRKEPMIGGVSFNLIPHKADYDG